MWLISIPIGLFIGALSGLIFLFILKTGFKETSLKHITAIIGELTALASFSLGGSWFAKGILKNVSGTDILAPYILSFAIMFFAIAARALYRAVIILGNQIGQAERSANG
jgi:hypothetical protein